MTSGTHGPIASILFDVFPATAKAEFGAEPESAHFNSGVSAEDSARFTAVFNDKPWLVTVAMSVFATGCVLGIATVLWIFLLASMGPAGLIGRIADNALLVWMALAAVVLSVTGAGGLYVATCARPAAKAWASNLRDAWSHYGDLLLPVQNLPAKARDEAHELLIRLEKIRKGLNRLDPADDELDSARAAMARYISASRLPALGDRMAAATHVKDPAVRRAAEEYKNAVSRRDVAHAELLAEINAASALLADRRRARSDAELIRLANKR